MKQKEALVEGETIAVSLGSDQRAVLRTLFCSDYFRHVEAMLLYAPCVWKSTLTQIAQSRPIGLVFTGGIGHPKWRDRVHRLGVLPLSAEEKNLPVYWSADLLYRRDRQLGVATDRDTESYPSLGGAGLDYMMNEVRVLSGLDPGLIDQDIHLLHQGNRVHLRFGAAFRLGNNYGCLAGRRAIDPLCQALRSDPGYKVRRVAARALGRITREDSAAGVKSALAAAAADDPHQEVREAAAEALKRIDDDELRF